VNVTPGKGGCVCVHGARTSDAIESRERTGVGEEAVHEIETIVFRKQPDGRWLIVHQHLSAQPD
jgi:ketosteroid isomerase-like protein